MGHSLGGLTVRLCASRWPAAVAGLVLLDQPHEYAYAAYRAAGVALPPEPQVDDAGHRRTGATIGLSG
jgi:pimeloyl-ACP methyl ester carboxylesterase